MKDEVDVGGSNISRVPFCIGAEWISIDRSLASRWSAQRTAGKLDDLTEDSVGPGLKAVCHSTPSRGDTARIFGGGAVLGRDYFWSLPMQKTLTIIMWNVIPYNGTRRCLRLK